MTTQAPGAMPLTGPRSTPNTFAEATGLPAAVVAVCVPCPLESRAVEYTSGGLLALWVARNACPPMSLLLQTNVSLAGVNGLSPKSHVRGVPSAFAGGAPRLPLSVNDGCSGQAPVSRPPKITPLPAFGLPPVNWLNSALAP